MSGIVVRAASSIARTWGDLRDAWRLGVKPQEGRTYTPSPKLDFLDLITDSMTMSRLRSEINAALSGELGRGITLFSEMESKDGRLRSVSNTRRQGLTNLDWEVVSAADLQDDLADRTLADEAAAFIRESFANLESFEEALEHLATGIGPNLSVVEMVWEGMKLAELVPVDGSRLRYEPTEPGTLLLMTDKDLRGVEMHPAKFIVHMPHGNDLYPFRKSLSRPQAWIYLMKMLSVADWKTFLEVFGMPVRVAYYDPGISTDDRNTLIEMMQNLGSRAWGVFSKAVTMEFKESSQRGTAPYEGFIAWCNRETSILWLGGHLTTDTTGGTGTLAAAQVHDEVRDDVRDDDIAKESRTLRRQLISPMCVFKYPGRDVPLPYFRRIKPEPIDRLQEAQVISAAQRAGMTVGKKWAHDRLSIPEPETDDETLHPLDAFESALEEGPSGPGL